MLQFFLYFSPIHPANKLECFDTEKAFSAFQSFPKRLQQMDKTDGLTEKTDRRMDVPTDKQVDQTDGKTSGMTNVKTDRQTVR